MIRALWSTWSIAWHFALNLVFVVMEIMTFCIIFHQKCNGKQPSSRYYYYLRTVFCSRIHIVRPNSKLNGNECNERTSMTITALPQFIHFAPCKLLFVYNEASFSCSVAYFGADAKQFDGMEMSFLVIISNFVTLDFILFYWHEKKMNFGHLISASFHLFASP